MALVVGLTPSHLAEAYQETTAGGSLVATVLPKAPGPQTDVTITLAGYGYDLNESTIAWALNNKEQQRGIGEKSFKFTTGKLGEITVITVAVKTKEGRAIAKQLIFIPAEVDILWEADTYVPPFYPGAPLVTEGSRVRLTAIPQLTTTSGRLIPSSQLTFTWRHNYRNLVQQSGRGKDYIEITAPSASSDAPVIEITVTSPTSDATAYRKITVPVTVPEIIIYPLKPLAGVVASEAIAETYQSKAEEESFIVEPYYFTKSEVASNYLTYTWRINSEPIVTNVETPRVLNTTQKKADQGEANVEIFVSSLNNNLRRASKSFKIILDKSFFGL